MSHFRSFVVVRLGLLPRTVTFYNKLGCNTNQQLLEIFFRLAWVTNITSAVTRVSSEFNMYHRFLPWRTTFTEVNDNALDGGSAL